MKTRNNIQKTVSVQVKVMVLRAATVIIGLALISLTVKAQDFWSQFSAANSADQINPKAFHCSVENKKIDVVCDAVDDELAVQLNYPVNVLVVEAEPLIKIEAWMTNESFFNSNQVVATQEVEDALKLEDWMISNVNFVCSSVGAELKPEPTLEGESQMINEDLIESKPESNIKIESWMISEKYFNSAETLTACGADK